MLRHSLLILAAAALVAAAACSGGGHKRGDVPNTAAPAEGTSSAGPGEARRETSRAHPDAPDGASDGAPGIVEFASTAFPPTLPHDDRHQNAWMRDDCILCHESGIGGAPLVQHTGMSQALLAVRCRTCHVPAGPPKPGEVRFARRAFPPTLPDDRDHAGAWLRDDCVTCHATGTDGAPRVVHQGMSELLLAARCRTCHVPAAGG